MRRRILIAALALLIVSAICAFFLRPKPNDVQSTESSDSSALSSPQPSLPRLAFPPGHPDASTEGHPGAASEAALMQQIRDNVRANPALAEALAREGRQRFPDSTDSDERDALLVDALINQQHIGAARSETYYYIKHHPTGAFAEHLFVMTGVHPTPMGPGQR